MSEEQKEEKQSIGQKSEENREPVDIGKNEREEDIEKTTLEKGETLEETVFEETPERAVPKETADEETPEGAMFEEEAPEYSASAVKQKNPNNPILVGGVVITVLLAAAIVVFLVGSALFKMKNFFPSPAKEPLPIAYSKEESLYVDDLKNPAYMVEETLTEGGQFHYYFMGNGVLFSEDGTKMFYQNKIKEDGTFDLYYKLVEQPEEQAILLEQNVIGFQISGDGNSCAYIKNGTQKGGTLCTVIINGSSNTTREIAENVAVSENAYFLSDTGKYVVYVRVGEESGAQLYASDFYGDEERLLSENLYSFQPAKKADSIYYVENVIKEDKTTYSIFEYQYKNDSSTLITDNASALAVLENQKDMVYFNAVENVVKCSDVIEDDMLESDKAIEIPDFGNDGGDKEAYNKKLADYHAKLDRDELRNEIKDADLVTNTQDVFLWSEGKSIEVCKNAENAKVLGEDGNYLIFTRRKDEVPKIKLSEITSMEEAQNAYYRNMAMAATDTFFIKPGEKEILIEGENIDIQSAKISQTKDTILFLTDIGRLDKLVVAKLDDKKQAIESYTELDENVKIAEFDNKTSALAYISDVENSMGTLHYYGGETAQKVANEVGLFQFGKDSDKLYFISDIDMAIGNGSLKEYVNGAIKDIDDTVLDIVNKENGTFVYLKDYDMMTQKGDLYYYNGKESRLVDTGVNSIFMQ